MNASPCTLVALLKGVETQRWSAPNEAAARRRAREIFYQCGARGLFPNFEIHLPGGVVRFSKAMGSRLTFVDEPAPSNASGVSYARPRFGL